MYRTLPCAKSCNKTWAAGEGDVQRIVRLLSYLEIVQVTEGKAGFVKDEDFPNESISCAIL